MAAQYRCLQDCLLNGVYNNAGDTITFSGVPGPYLDPLTPDAVTAFYNAGPQATVLVRPQWTGQAAVPAVTFWSAVALPAVPGVGTNEMVAERTGQCLAADCCLAAMASAAQGKPQQFRGELTNGDERIRRRRLW